MFCVGAFSEVNSSARFRIKTLHAYICSNVAQILHMQNSNT